MSQTCHRPVWLVLAGIALALLCIGMGLLVALLFADTIFLRVIGIGLSIMGIACPILIAIGAYCSRISSSPSDPTTTITTGTTAQDTMWERGHVFTHSSVLPVGVEEVKGSHTVPLGHVTPLPPIRDTRAGKKVP